MRRGVSFVLGLALVIGVLGAQPVAAAPVAPPPEEAAVAAADEAGTPDASTHAGGSTEIEVVAGPAAGPVVVDLAWTRVGGDLRAADITAEAQPDPAVGRFEDLAIQGSAAQRTAGAFHGAGGVPGGGATHRIRTTFTRAGRYTVTAAVRPAAGGAPLSTTTQEVLVASAFTPIGVAPLNTEIVDVTPDGSTLLSTAGNGIGFVDITDPGRPGAVTVVPTVGSVTSVATTPDGQYALVASSAVHLGVVDIATRQEIRRIDMPRGGDSVTVSDDGRYAAVAIENEAGGVDGSVVLVDLVGPPSEWTTRQVTFPAADPALDRSYSPTLQPEYVDFSPENELAVTIQENNAVAVIDAPTGEVVELWSAGSVTRDTYDSGRNYRYEFDQTMTLARQPDAVQWTPEGHLLTADEGESQGSRGWTLWTRDGEVLYDAGTEGIEVLHAMNGGHGDGGIQFEGADVATFSSGETFAFVGAERAASVSVARIEGEQVHPSQVLLTNYRVADPRPEGVLAVPQRDLVLVSNEDDNTVVIYRRVEAVSPRLVTPTITSHTEMWADLRGASPIDTDELWAVNARQGLPHALHRLTVNATEVQVDQRIPLTRDGAPIPEAAGAGLKATAADPVGGGAWVASLTGRPDVRGNPGVDVVARVGADGAVTEEIDVAGPTDEVVALATTADGATLYALGQSKVEAPGSDRLRAVLYERTVATGVTRRFTIPAEIAAGYRDLDVTPAGDLLVSSSLRTTGSNPDAEIFEIQLAGAVDGGRLPVSFVRDVAATDRFDMPAQSIASLGAGELAVMATTAEFGRSRFQRVPAPLGEGATGSTTLVSPSGDDPVEVGPGEAFPVRFRTQGGGGYLVDTRPAGSSDPWTPLPGAAGVLRPPFGTQQSVAVPTEAPLLAGPYDVRLRFWNRSGTVQTRNAPGTLVVSTTVGTVALESPTEADPAASPGHGQPLAVTFTTDRAGTFQVRTKPAGTPADEYTALDVLEGATVDATTGLVADPGTVTAVVGAPAADGDHDLQVVFRAGGDPALEAADAEAAAVTVTTVPAGAITLDSPTATGPVTTLAGATTPAAVTVDTPGTLTIDARPVGSAQAWIPLLEQPVDPGPVEATLSPLTIDGAYDLRATLTTASGFATTDEEPGALLVSTPAPVVTTPITTADPLRREAGDVFTAPVTVNAPGTASFEVRTAGSDTWSIWGDVPVDPTTTEIDAFAPAQDGTHDVRIVFTNVLGQQAVVEVPAGMVVETPPVEVDLLSPRAGVPLRAIPDTTIAVVFTYDRDFGASWIEYRPAGAGEDAWERLLNASSTSTGGRFRAGARIPNIEPGAYDLRIGVENRGRVANVIPVPGGLEVGPGAGSPDVVIEEMAPYEADDFDARYVEVRNTSSTPVALTGWTLVECYDFLDVDAATVPAGVTLAPGERYLFATEEAGVDEDLLFAPADFSAGGFRLLRPDGTFADGVSFDRCGEGDQLDHVSDSTLSYQRDAGGSDTDVNPVDLTPQPRTPQGRGSFGAPTVRIATPSAAAPATGLPGAAASVTFTSNQAGPYTVEAGAGDDDWAAVGSGTAAVGPTTAPITLPAGAGTYDLRVRVTASDQAGADVEADALRVTAAPVVDVTSPTDEDPVTVVPEGPVTVTFTTDQAGPYEVAATAPAGARVVLGTGTAVVGANTVTVTAPLAVADHDLTVTVTGPTGARGNTEDDALRVRPLPTVTILDPTAAAPEDVAVGVDVGVRFTSDQAGPYVVELRPDDVETWTQVAQGEAAVGMTNATIPGREVGTYDIRVRVTGPAGETTATAPNAFVVHPQPVLTITSPTTGEPSVGARGRSVDVTFTADQVVLYEVRIGDGPVATGLAGVGTTTVAVTAPSRSGTHAVTLTGGGMGGEGSDTEAGAVVTHETTSAEITAATRFVAAAHRTFLDREATDAELTAGVGRLLGGTPRSVIVDELARSDEWIGRSVDALYRSILGRPADPDGLAFWTARVRDGLRLTQVGVGFYAAPEYYASVGATPEGYVASLYETLLERDGAADEIAYWAGRLEAGASRSSVAKGFYASIESRRARVVGLYQAVLDRDPDAAGRDFWAERLLTRDDVVLAASLAASGEYFANAQR